MKEQGETDMGTSLPNVMPLVEVSLFLLLVTMGTAAAQQHELKVRLAHVKSATAVSHRPQPTLFVRVDRNGNYRVQGNTTPVTLDKVEDQIRQTAKETLIVVEPEQSTEWEPIAHVLSAADDTGREAKIGVAKKKENRKCLLPWMPSTARSHSESFVWPWPCYFSFLFPFDPAFDGCFLR